jgi:hypothetical protein
MSDMILSPHAGARRSLCVASTAVHAAIAVFAALMLLAMRAYPGGTAWDPTTRGNDFWLNYLCDLARGVALDREPNPVGSALARAAMIILALGFAPFFLSLPSLFPARARLGFAIRLLGCAGALGSVVVGLLPNDRFGAVHVYLILSSGVPCLAASALGVFGLARGGPALRAAAAGGGAMLAVSAIDLVIYLAQQSATGPAPVALAVLERCATILVLAWMYLVAREL